MRGQQKDEERTKQLIKLLEDRLAGYEAILGKTKYLAGDVSALSILLDLYSRNIC